MSGFSSALKQNKAVSELIQNVAAGKFPVGALGAATIHKALIIHSICDEEKRRAFVITPDEAVANKLADDLKAFGTSAQVFPSRDISLIFEQTPSKEYERQRMGALTNWVFGNVDVVLIPAIAAIQKTIPREVLLERILEIKEGSEVELEKLVQSLHFAGYKRADEVEGQGQFAVRGGIVDFFPPNRERPIRVEFFGDEIDTIAEFDPLSQRRTDKLDSVMITPSVEIYAEDKSALSDKIEKIANRLKRDVVKEKLYKEADNLREGISDVCLDKYINLIYENPMTPLSFLGERDLLFVLETSSIRSRINGATKVYHEDIKDAVESGNFIKQFGDLQVGFEYLIEDYKNANTIFLDNFASGSFDIPISNLVNINLGQTPVWDGTLSTLKEFLFEKDVKTVIAAGNEKAAKSLEEDLRQEGFKVCFALYPPLDFPKNFIVVTPTIFSSGFRIPEGNFQLITRGLISSSTKRVHKGNAKNAFHSLDELQKGDYIVHNVYGIGIFDGIVTLDTGGFTKDYIKIKYAKTDVLYVPVTQLDLVSKYIGPKDDTKRVKINRLGGNEWEKAKSKVRSAVKDMAQQLTELYAKRMLLPGYPFSVDTDMQSEFECHFEYNETDDQLRCISEIKHDMERSVPMDRLLCGDVGFGKTEVALRAAFKCVVEGKQCAILVPTTILAFQHFNTIVKRFDGFPIEIAMLSRFKTPSEQRKIIRDVKAGYVDIVVGTHRLISKDIEFKDLGLLIVDEEQRFGVAQKEKLKEKFPNVDVLTLSATPIPRTLNMAMSGIRDMSIIEEAPVDRYPVQTYVLEYDDGVIAQAIEKELRRGGQVYYLHNNVESIASCAARIHELVPNARIGIAHGKMDEEKLSSIWKSLVEGEIDILVCTTIIETGVDVPNVNTLIIENSDRFGLSQLHQIRGRIGRSSRRATAYFTFQAGKELTEIAAKRLMAIREYTEFGSGFKIAMRDMELRGAGALLGAQQHGHMEAVGYDMYFKILSETIEELRGEKENRPVEIPMDCTVDIEVDAHIPEDYIDSIKQRVTAYRRIADIRTLADKEDVLDELCDRFGTPPKPVLGLIEVPLIRASAAKIGIHDIIQRGGEIYFYWKEIDYEAVSRLDEVFENRVGICDGQKPFTSLKISKSDDIITLLKDVLNILTK